MRNLQKNTGNAMKSVDEIEVVNVDVIPAVTVNNDGNKLTPEKQVTTMMNAINSRTKDVSNLNISNSTVCDTLT
jgi:hypothetical protein